MPKNKNSYWAERARKDKLKVIKTGEQGIDNLKRLLLLNIKDVEKQIKDFYEKYGENPAEELSNKNWQRYKKRLRDMAKANPQDKTLQKLAKQNIPKYKIDRLRALELDLQMQLTEATNGQAKGIYNTLDDVSKVSQATLASRMNRTLGLTFNAISANKMKQILMSDWSGANWSERLWKDREKVGKKLTEVLEKGIPQGTSLQKMSRELRDLTGESFNNAFRLIRTETSHIDGQVTLEGYKQASEELGLQYYEYDAFLDSRTSSFCRELDGKRFKITDAEVGVNYPPRHPNCRSTTQLVLDEDYKQEEKPKEEAKEAEKPVEYKKFNNKETLNEYFYNNENYQKWLNNLTENEQEAICAYTDNSDDVNKFLRKIGDWEYINKELITDQIKQIDNALKEFILDEPIQVLRGVGEEPFKGKLEDLQSLIGMTFNDKAFLSTSPLKAGAKNDKPVEMIINIPSGKGRGAYINQISVFEDIENEFLIARDSNFIIKNAKQENGRYLIEMDLIDD